ncbi:MAG: 5-(carboxyamino)imidazole ribonucleotide synthase [Pseudomonadota bacterium]
MPHTPLDNSAPSLSAVSTVGIAGGGQLGLMMAEAANTLNIKVVALDPDAQCSVVDNTEELIVANFDSVEGINQLGEKSDVVTFEIERISVDALAELEEKGIPVRPSSKVLNIIQDKLLQKQFLRENNIPTSDFTSLDSPSDIEGQLPRVWKARRDGYDGRGVQIIRSKEQIAELPGTPALGEELVDIDYELAIMIARGVDGTVRHYPLTEIEMDPDAHVMLRVIAPARVPSRVHSECCTRAEQVVNALDYVGVMALEFFVDRGGNVFVNELSPRPHNSGHYTIEACVTSQFEQHMRAVAGHELGDTTIKGAAVTFNVLGAEGAWGKPYYVGFDQTQPNVFFHNYGKSQVRPGRKMAHVTVLGEDRETAMALADEIHPNIRVESTDD